MRKEAMVMWSLMIFGMLFQAANSVPFPSPANEITCQDAMQKVMPCSQYLKGTAPPDPPVACCDGANEVYHKADTTQCRRNICECFKKAAIDLGVEPDRAKQLPALCHIPLTIPIDPKVDCTSITI